MRVLQLISSRGFGGAESVALELSGALRARGHEVTIALLHKPGLAANPLAAKAEALGIRVVPLASGGRVDAALVWRLRGLLRGSRIDVLHAHNYKANLYGYFASRGLQVATVSTCHNWTDRTGALRVYGALDRLALRLFDRVVAVSPSTAARLGAGYSGRLTVIENGIRFPALADVRGASAGGALRVGCVARLSHEKGVDLLLRAAAEALGRMPGLRFSVAGEGPERARLLALRGSLGLDAAVEFVGFQADVADFLAGVDLFVQPSRVDAMPMSVLEGMAAGLPVVAPAIGGIPALLGGGERGLLFPAEDVGALADRIVALGMDAEARKRLGAAAAAYVRAHCGADRMAERYERVYEEAHGAGMHCAVAQ